MRRQARGAEGPAQGMCGERVRCTRRQAVWRGSSTTAAHAPHVKLQRPLKTLSRGPTTLASATVPAGRDAGRGGWPAGGGGGRQALTSTRIQHPRSARGQQMRTCIHINDGILEDWDVLPLLDGRGGGEHEAPRAAEVCREVCEQEKRPCGEAGCQCTAVQHMHPRRRPTSRQQHGGLPRCSPSTSGCRWCAASTACMAATTSSGSTFLVRHA